MSMTQINSALWISWGMYWTITSRSTQKTNSSEGLLLRASHLVPLLLGFLLIFWPSLLGLDQYPTPLKADLLAEIIGIVLTFAGLVFSVWARVHLGKYWSGIITLKEGHRLIRSGPYQLVRHPIYTGFLLAVLGSAVTSGSIEGMIGFLVVTVSYFVKVRREESILSQQFGDEYLRFKKDVRALIPYLY